MRMNCEYVKEYYGVPCDIGRRILYHSDYGTIYKDGGNYTRVNFDKDKPGECVNIHPTDPALIYKDDFAELRIPKFTRSQQRYQDYLHSAYYDAGDSFAVYLGVKQ